MDSNASAILPWDATATAKGNGINDGFVCWDCDYAVVFWLSGFRIDELCTVAAAAINFAENLF